MKSSVLFFNAAILTLLCQELVATGSSSDKERKTGSSIQFIPTNEWQRVEKGERNHIK